VRSASSSVGVANTEQSGSGAEQLGVQRLVSRDQQDLLTQSALPISHRDGNSTVKVQPGRPILLRTRRIARCASVMARQDGQPQAGALIFCRYERVENLFDHIVRNAASSVRDLDQQGGATSLGEIGHPYRELPPESMASRAFKHRFRKSCSN